MSILNNVIESLERIFRYLTESCRMYFRVASGETCKFAKFDFLQWLSAFQEIRENLSTAANIRKIAIQALYYPLEIAIFRDKIIGGWNGKIDTRGKKQENVSSLK